jgi:phosphatidate phosphatase PAH1
VWLDDCRNVVKVASAKTNDDGRAKLEITAPDRAGEYAMHFIADGDASVARATLWVLERGTPVVVFDIDGTLTQSDAEVNKDVLDDRFNAMYGGDYVPKAYADGATLADIWIDKGVLPIYISGRPYWLVQYSRDWLVAEKFPRGFVRTTDRHRDVLPKVDGVGKFKAATLRQLLDLGLDVQAAYGNAKTDIWAYADVGLPIDRTFIIGPHAGEQGTRAVSDAWTAALPWAREQPVPNAALTLR